MCFLLWSALVSVNMTKNAPSRCLRFSFGSYFWRGFIESTQSSVKNPIRTICASVWSVFKPRHQSRTRALNISIFPFHHNALKMSVLSCLLLLLFRPFLMSFTISQINIQEKKVLGRAFPFNRQVFFEAMKLLPNEIFCFEEMLLFPTEPLARVCAFAWFVITVLIGSLIPDFWNIFR